MPPKNSINESLVSALKEVKLNQEMRGITKNLDLGTIGQLAKGHAQLPSQLLQSQVDSAVGMLASDPLKMGVMASARDMAQAARLKQVVGASAYGFLDDQIKNQLTGGLAELIRARDMTPPLEPMRLPTFTRPEDTKLGRAALATAEQLQEVVRLNSTMVGQMTSLTQLFIADVFPQWQQKLRDDQVAADDARKTAEADAIKRQNGAQESLNQANRSLKVAKWALIASVFASFLAVGWQLRVAKIYRDEDALAQKATQKASDAFLAKQQEVLEKLNRQLDEAEKAREVEAGATKNRPKAVALSRRGGA